MLLRISESQIVHPLLSGRAFQVYKTHGGPLWDSPLAVRRCLGLTPSGLLSAGSTSRPQPFLLYVSVFGYLRGWLEITTRCRLRVLSESFITLII